MPTTSDILAVILGGGRGARLYPLTAVRSKPAVPIAGKYRLIDIPISNCINSGIYKIAVLTQFNSVSLHRHLTSTYSFDAFHTGWVQVWAAEQTVSSADWYQGTADAVRKQLFEIRAARTPYTLVLAGDHLYRMDYKPMFEFHLASGAEATVAVQPINASDAGRFGVLKRDASQRITRFAEKPKDPATLAEMVSRDDSQRPFLGSMGIYLFNTATLIDLLESHLEYDDFGKDVIPCSIASRRVFGFDFDDYWEDVGTIRSFYETNLALTDPKPPFNFYDPIHPIYTHARFLPGSIIRDSILERALIAEGCCIQKAHIVHSIIGLRSQIHCGVTIRDSIVMGADYYEEPSCAGIPRQPGNKMPIGIGDNSEINCAIIDKNARIGSGVKILPFKRGTELDGINYVVRDGVVVIPKDAILDDGTIIAPDS